MESLRNADAAKGATPLLAAANSLHDRRRDRPPAIAVVDELSKLLPQNVWLESLSLDDARLELKGQGSDIPALIAVLEGSPALKDVNFAAATQLNEELKSNAFSIGATLESGGIGQGAMSASGHEAGVRARACAGSRPWRARAAGGGRQVSLLLLAAGGAALSLACAAPRGGGGAEGGACTRARRARAAPMTGNPRLTEADKPERMFLPGTTAGTTLAAFQSIVNEAATRTGMSVLRTQPLPTDEAEGLSPYRLAVDATGSLEQLRAFLTALESSLPVIIVTGFEIQPRSVRRPGRTALSVRGSCGIPQARGLCLAGCAMNRNLIVLSAIAVLLGAYAAVDWLPGLWPPTGRTGTDEAAPAATSAGGRSRLHRAKLNPLEGLAAESFAAVLERPLFNPGRTPRPRGTAATSAAAGGTAPTRSRRRLQPAPTRRISHCSPLRAGRQGLSQRFASLPRARCSTCVEGQPVEQWTLISVSDRSVVIGTPEDNVTISMFEHNDDEPPPPSTPEAPPAFPGNIQPPMTPEDLRLPDGMQAPGTGP